MGTSFLILLVAVTIGVTIYFISQKKDEKKPTGKSTSEPELQNDLRDVHQEDMQAESKFTIQKIMDKLIRLNIQLRTSGKSTKQILVSFEKLIDKIRELAIIFHAEQPDNDLTWQIDEMVVDFIPSLLRDYLKSKQGELEQQHIISTCEELFLQLSELAKEYEDTTNVDLKRNASIIKETMRIRSKIPVESKTEA